MFDGIRSWLAAFEKQFAEELENTKTKTLQSVGIITGASLAYGVEFNRPEIAHAAFWLGIPFGIAMYFLYLWEFGILKAVRKIGQ